MKSIKKLTRTVVSGIFGRSFYERLRFFKQHGYWPHIAHPRSFNEHVIHRKLNGTIADAARLADKVAVRDYVVERGCGFCLNKTYWIGDNPDDLDWDSLPSSFVAKGAHGCGPDFMIIVRDKGLWTAALLKHHLRRILELRYGDRAAEPWYNDIKPRIIIEALLTDGTYDVPLDYKFHVFHGKVHYVHVDIDRNRSWQRSIYDRHWQRATFTFKRPLGPDMDRPAPFDTMVAIAEKLGRGLDYVRIDLYCINNRDVVFGEVTLTPAAGYSPFTPTSYDFMWGDLWRTT